MMPSSVQVHVDLGIGTALADELEPRQLLEERGADRRPLPDEHQRLRVGETGGEHSPGRRRGLSTQ